MHRILRKFSSDLRNSRSMAILIFELYSVDVVNSMKKAKSCFYLYYAVPYSFVVVVSNDIGNFICIVSVPLTYDQIYQRRRIKYKGLFQKLLEVFWVGVIFFFFRSATLNLNVLIKFVNSINDNLWRFWTWTRIRMNVELRTIPHWTSIPSKEEKKIKNNNVLIFFSSCFFLSLL